MFDEVSGPTRQEVANFNRQECIEMLEAHGLDINPDADVDLAGLRNTTMRTVFFERES